jgi:hypothetical protein
VDHLIDAVCLRADGSRAHQLPSAPSRAMTRQILPRRPSEVGGRLVGAPRPPALHVSDGGRRSLERERRKSTPQRPVERHEGLERGHRN